MGEFEKMEVRYQVTKNLDLGVCVLYLCNSELRLHLSIAFESKLLSFSIRFAQTILFYQSSLQVFLA